MSNGLIHNLSSSWCFADWLHAIVIRGVTMNAGRHPARGRVEDVRPLADLLNRGGMETEILADPRGRGVVEIRLQLRHEPSRRAHDERQRLPPRFTRHARADR